MALGTKDLEATLLQDPRIQRATVVHRDDGLLLAEISVRDSAASMSLIELIGGTRPDQPVVLVMEGSAGKLDVSAAQRRAQIDTPYEIAQTTHEHQMIALWQNLLDWAPVGRRDNFFDLGGDSLIGMTLMERLVDAYGVELDVHDLLYAPVLHEFTSRMLVLKGPI